MREQATPKKENRMGTFGYMQPFCFAEDEQTTVDIGWNPYHVNNGFDLNAIGSAK